MLHPQISGVWAREISVFGEVERVHSWPHGDESASWTIPTGTSHPALRANAPVAIYDGGLVVWRGILNEPGRDGKVTARGLWTLARDVLALDSLGNPTRVPDVAIDAAIARGALPGWKRPATLSSAAWGSTDTTGDLTVAALLDQWAAGAGLRWAVDSRGVVYAAADPTEPVWAVPSAVAGSGLTLAEDEFVTHLVGRYLTSATTAATFTLGSDPAAAKWGRKEEVVDLTPMGAISQATAQAQLQGMFNLAGGRMHYAEGLELAHGQILTLGGTVAPLAMIRAGQKVRLHGVADLTRPVAFYAYTDVTIGRVVFRDGSGVVQIDPTDLAARSLADVLKVAVAEDDATDSGARAQVAIVATSAASAQSAASTAQSTANTALANANTALGLRPVGHTHATSGSATNLPNDNILRTCVIQGFAVPSNARLAVVTIHTAAHNVTNAAGRWEPNVTNGVGGYVNQAHAYHNQGNPAVNTGFSSTFVVDAAAHVANGLSLQVVLNASNDPGSGSWTHVGYTQISVTFLGY